MLKNGQDLALSMGAEVCRLQEHVYPAEDVW